VQWDLEERPLSSRGRHRAPSGASRVRARATVAAVTTGTVAISGVALAGCATTDTSADTHLDDASVTSGMSLASQFGARVNTGTAAAPISLASSIGLAKTLDATTDIAAPTLTSKVDVGLQITNPDVTVAADQPIEIGFKLYQEADKTPLADQLVKVQVKLPTGFATFLNLKTNNDGYTSYTARVLTTTQITAVFDGTDALQSATADNVGTLHVRPVVPVQASRSTVRAASTSIAAPPSNGSLGEKAVYLASLQAGKPYVYGGSGPNSFDCSGLTQYVYKQLGRNLPRTAEAQYEATPRVSQFNKQIGDLIFFGSPGNIYHMGIYAGDGKMWVAPRTGQNVQLQTIYSTTYSVGRVA
jgi:cell wall-associated NlpC family hydrolase